MKVKIYVLDLELPKPTRKALRIIGLAAVLIAGGTIAAYAAVRHTFESGDMIVAQQVNENFAELDTRLVDVEERSRDGVRISLSGVMCGASGPTTGAISDPGSGTIGWRAAKII